MLIIFVRGAVNTYGSAMYGLSDFPAWADPDHSLNCSLGGLGGLNMSSSHMVTTALPSPVAADLN